MVTGFASLTGSLPALVDWLDHAYIIISGVDEDIETMCRNIRTLFNFEPPATEDEIRASALQFVRKLSGFTQPSKANAAAFQRAVDEVSDVARRLLQSLETNSPPRDREIEAEKARARAKERYGERIF
jgi:hypothetical protein